MISEKLKRLYEEENKALAPRKISLLPLPPHIWKFTEGKTVNLKTVNFNEQSTTWLYKNTDPIHTLGDSKKKRIQEKDTALKIRPMTVVEKHRAYMRTQRAWAPKLQEEVKIELKTIKDGDLEPEEDTKQLIELDIFERRSIFHKKDEEFRPIVYA